MRSRSTVLPAALGLGLGLLTGCVAVGTSFDVAAAPAGLARVSRAFAAALDEAPDEVFRILRPPAPPEPEVVTDGPREPERPPRTARLKFGLRGGMLRSSGADVEWTGSTYYGVYLRRIPVERRRMTFELAANYAVTEREDEFLSSTLYTLHGDLVFGRVGGRGVSVYLLAGGAAVIEQGTNNVSGETQSGRGGGAEVGVGIGSAGGSWDLRGVYTQIIATANANGLLSVSFGIAF